MKTGLLCHDPDRAWPGYTLYSETWEDARSSPDGKGEILLIDMAGASCIAGASRPRCSRSAA